MLNPKFFLTLKTCLFLAIFTSNSCGTLGSLSQSQKELDLSIKTYNLEFESKAIDASAQFVHPLYRPEYLSNSLEVRKRITFFDSTIIDIRFFNNGVPTTRNSNERFDRAIVIIRYQVTVLPRTKLETITVEQEWVRYQDQWVTIPDLALLLER